jgi:MFS family permease
VTVSKGKLDMATDYVQKLRLFGRDVRLYLIAVALGGLAQDGIRNVLLNLYLLRLGYEPKAVGTANAAFALAFTLFCFPASALGARWSLRRALIAGQIVQAVGIGLLPLAEFVPPAWETGWVMATLAVNGVGLALHFVNGVPFLMAATGPEERNHAFSMQVGLIPLAAFVGNLVGGALPAAFASVLQVSVDTPLPYRYPLWISAALYAPGALALSLASEVGGERSRAHMAEEGRVPYGLIGLVALIVVFRLAGRMTAMTFFNVYLDAGLELPTIAIGVLSAVGQLLSVPAALVAPLLVARWGNRATIVWGSLGIALSLLPLAFIPHWSAAGIGFVGVTALFSLTTAPLRVFTQETTSPRWRAAMSGAVMMGAGLSISAMALGGGYLIAALGYRGLFLTGAGLTVAGALLFWASFGLARRGLVRVAIQDRPD